MCIQVLTILYTGLKASVQKQNIHKNTRTQGEVHKHFRRPTRRTATQESITEQFRGPTGRPAEQRYKAVQFRRPTMEK